ncbi:SDR family NAD(P)-dependent oxidoreductase [Cryptosporangium sp. NPDC048952]|uniref:SDR family NAD(P)-dependent oxidoreductase n=1 Tax=Cryptosporangium sp. NPDC048952 TaxID=3363961 RepID=UPI0037201B3E
MTTFAIVGAGPGVGAAVARRFGREGFSIALISRSGSGALTDALVAEGFAAQGFAADVRDRSALVAALDAAAFALGPIEVLQYSPIPQREFLRPVLETSHADLEAALEFSVHGPVAAVQQVLPGMRELGRGTVALVNGGSAARPNAAVAGTSVAFAAESAYAQMLHGVLAPENIHVTQLIVPGAIREDDPVTNGPAIADHIWTLHSTRERFRHFHTPLPDP